MSTFRIAWLLGARRDRRSRAALLVTLAVLVFGLALQSARACATAVNVGGPVTQASVHAEHPSDDAEHCHHREGAIFDACFVHCEQDGQSARTSLDTGADDLRVAILYSPGAYDHRPALPAIRESAIDARSHDLPAYLRLHRLNR